MIIGYAIAPVIYRKYPYLKVDLQFISAPSKWSISEVDNKWRDTDQVLESRSGNIKDLGTAVKEVIGWLKSNKYHVGFSAIGHRLVQGGPEHRQPEVVTARLLKILQQFTYLAPNHLPDENTTPLMAFALFD